MSGTGVYPLHSLATQYPSAKLYQLGSTLEPYRLLEENEQLRRNLLETSTALRSSVAVVPAEVEALKHEVEHLRAVALGRLREVEEWKRRLADGKRGEDARAAQLKAEVEREVVSAMEREVEARLGVYRRDVSLLREENLRLAAANEELRRELQGLSEAQEDRLRLVRREWEQTLESLIREELRRREAAFDSEKLLRDVEVRELKEHIGFLERKVDGKQQEVRKLDRDYAEAVGARKEELSAALKQRFQAELELQQAGKDRMLAELVSANRELKEELFQLERKLALGEEAHRQELEALRGGWQRSLESSRHEELARLKELHRAQTDKYEAELLFLRQKLKAADFQPLPLLPAAENPHPGRTGLPAPLLPAQLPDADLAQTLAYFNIAPLRSDLAQDTRRRTPDASPAPRPRPGPQDPRGSPAEDFSASGILERIKQSLA